MPVTLRDQRAEILGWAIARVRAETACLKFELKMRAYADYLTEQKYRADQPRVPKGTSEGGWSVGC